MYFHLGLTQGCPLKPGKAPSVVPERFLAS
jgi:hypothetical protein